jgi:hypothetical protein
LAEEEEETAITLMEAMADFRMEVLEVDTGAAVEAQQILEAPVVLMDPMDQEIMDLGEYFFKVELELIHLPIRIMAVLGAEAAEAVGAAEAAVKETLFIAAEAVEVLHLSLKVGAHLITGFTQETD